MKHRLFSSLFTAMVGALAFTSCNSEIVDNTSIVGKKQMTFTASYDKTINSRTSLGSDLSVLWATDDAISVFDATDNNAFEISKGIGASTAEFNGTASEASAYYAVYPYQSSATISGNVISGVVIPAEQKAIANTFDPKANIMTALSNSANNLAFKNVCSYAKITTTTSCKKIIFTAGDDDKIAGTFNMTVGVDGIASTTAISGVNAVTLVPSSGSNFDAGTYYIAINAGTISNLFIQCVSTDKVYERSINVIIEAFTRGNIIDLGIVDIANGWSATCCPDENHPHFIDLGLPSGVKWACMNIDARCPNEYGSYFSWGEVTGCKINDDHTMVPTIMDGYPISWEGQTNPNYIKGETKMDIAVPKYYKWCNGIDQNMLKYCTDSSYGIVDGKTILEPQDDAATMNWGNAYHMPQGSDITELINNCYWLWTADYNHSGISGYIVYKAKIDSDKGQVVYSNGTPLGTYTLSDKHIFLPTTGSVYMSNSSIIGMHGSYWCASHNFNYGTGVFPHADVLQFGTTNLRLNSSSRNIGHPVRAVCQ